MRGFSISEQVAPIIVLNGQDMPRGKIFTLLHEFGHLVLQNTGICDLHESRRVVTDEDRVEVYANHVAGAVLIPQSMLLQEHLVATNSSRREWLDDDILSLAEKYAVSQEAMLRRLVVIGRASLDFYQAKREEFLRIYAERRKNKPQGAPPYHRLVIRDNGIPYTQLVLRSYYERRITACDVSDYLDINLKHLNNIEREVFSPLVTVD